VRRIPLAIWFTGNLYPWCSRRRPPIKADRSCSRQVSR
jgi:hypothetical protein